MREIKFRAWDKKSKTMSEPFNLKWALDSTSAPKVWENCIFSQFTGLHDKNGKEIYEGDIVKLDNVIGKVVWYQSECKFDVTNFTEDWHYRAHDYEIIGNIHTMPELLK